MRSGSPIALRAVFHALRKSPIGWPLRWKMYRQSRRRFASRRSMMAVSSPSSGSTRVLVTKLATPPGDDKLTLKGEVTLPHLFNPPLDPLTNGVRLLINDSAGNLLDLTIPGGAFVDPPAAGWKVNAKVPVSKWTYLNKTLAPPAGITKVVAQDKSLKLPGLVKFLAKGKNGSYAAFSANLPLTGLMVLDPPTAETGQCGELGFPGPAPSPACVFDPVAGKLKCK